MNVAGPEDSISGMLETFPHLVELYPLNLFLSKVLQALARIVEGAPVGLYMVDSGTLVIHRSGQVLEESMSADLAAELMESTSSGRIATRKLGTGTVARALAGVAELQLSPCRILARPLGYLLFPVGARNDPRLPVFSRLIGYYLHRQEIEQRVERLGRHFVIMGCHPQIFRLQEDLERFAQLREPVLILGESGSGKEIVALALHVLSRRREGPFVSVNCGASPSENLLIDEFFGHRRGAFTGAEFDKEGCCQQADHGTLFLDEIGDMAYEAQTLLLRTLTTSEIRRLGDRHATRVDIRFVSATHKDLFKGSQDRTFRADLYYRISAFQVRIPPLRERLSDLPHLSDYILDRFAQHNGLATKHLSEAARRRLHGHFWLGNIRELENVLRSAFVLADGQVIEEDHLHFDATTWHPIARADDLIFEIHEGGQTFWDAVWQPFMRREVTREDVALMLEQALDRCGGSLKRSALFLNIAPDEYPRFVAFLHRHGFRRRPADGPAVAKHPGGGD